MHIVAIIPCYRVKAKVKSVIESIDPQTHIICVDDACPEESGRYIESLGHPNVTVLYNPQNLGVGGAVKAGYTHALIHTTGDIFVKIDGDGQMPGEQIPALTAPILTGKAEYVKGNRFYYLRNLRGTPTKRLLGNLALSFLTKLSSGYWDIMDPTNGFTAISRAKLQELQEVDLHRLDNRYFFESDMLAKLYLLNTVVHDYPMKALYADEQSSLQPLRIAAPFLLKNIRNMLRRIVYTYFVRDFNAGSLALLMAVILSVWGIIYSLINWSHTFETGVGRPFGVVMLAALSMIFALQFLLFFCTVDMQNNPNLKRR